jgi:hypothetical protein
MERNRLTVQGAAARLGVTEQAIRKRVKRGTLSYDKDPDGRVYVYLDKVTDADRDEVRNPASDALISQMEARIESLERSLDAEREANRENRRLLAAALERRELAGPEHSETGARSSTSDAGGAAEPRPDDTSNSRGSHEPAGDSPRRPWWRRLF